MRRSPGIYAELSYLENLLQQDRDHWVPRILPVLLPGFTEDDVPDFLHPYTTDHYRVSGATPEGTAGLLRTLQGEPAVRRPAVKESPL